MNEIQHQQNHIWFKGKNLENKAHKCHQVYLLGIM